MPATPGGGARAEFILSVDSPPQGHAPRLVAGSPKPPQPATGFTGRGAFCCSIQSRGFRRLSAPARLPFFWRPARWSAFGGATGSAQLKRAGPCWCWRCHFSARWSGSLPHRAGRPPVCRGVILLPQTKQHAHLHPEGSKEGLPDQIAASGPCGPKTPPCLRGIEPCHLRVGRESAAFLLFPL